MSVGLITPIPFRFRHSNLMLILDFFMITPPDLAWVVTRQNNIFLIVDFFMIIPSDLAWVVLRQNNFFLRNTIMARKGQTKVITIPLVLASLLATKKF